MAIGEVGAERVERGVGERLELASPPPSVNAILRRRPAEHVADDRHGRRSGRPLAAGASPAVLASASALEPLAPRPVTGGAATALRPSPETHAGHGDAADAADDPAAGRRTGRRAGGVVGRCSRRCRVPTPASRAARPRRPPRPAQRSAARVAGAARRPASAAGCSPTACPARPGARVVVARAPRGGAHGARSRRRRRPAPARAGRARRRRGAPAPAGAARRGRARSTPDRSNGMPMIAGACEAKLCSASRSPTAAPAPRPATATVAAVATPSTSPTPSPGRAPHDRRLQRRRVAGRAGRRRRRRRSGGAGTPAAGSARRSVATRPARARRETSTPACTRVAPARLAVRRCGAPSAAGRARRRRGPAGASTIAAHAQAALAADELLVLLAEPATRAEQRALDGRAAHARAARRSRGRRGPRTRA